MKAKADALKDQPFAIIGVNSDGDRSDLLPRFQTEGINFRNAMDGSTSGPIASAWNVRGWPTAYVIDHEGIIRKKFVGVNPAELDAIVKELLERVPKNP
jgi:hypothetical protein